MWEVRACHLQCEQRERERDKSRLLKGGSPTAAWYTYRLLYCRHIDHSRLWRILWTGRVASLWSASTLVQTEQ
jgi:hypothetical protein